MRGEDKKVLTATGALNAYDEILMGLEPQPTELELVEEAEFTDPATRLSLRKAVAR